jgi:hypothetical protein
MKKIEDRGSARREQLGGLERVTKILVVTVRLSLI